MVLGAASAAAAGRLLSSVLFVSAFDVVSFAVGLSVLSLATLAATVVPALAPHASTA